MPCPINSTNINDFFNDKWLINWINIKIDTLYNITISSQYLDINSLFNFCCAKFAILLRKYRLKHEKYNFKIFDFNSKEFVIHFLNKNIKTKNNYSNDFINLIFNYYCIIKWENNKFTIKNNNITLNKKGISSVFF